jgi:hypothetical protein
MITDLLSHTGLPQLPVLDQFIKSLCVVLDVVGSGVCNTLPRYMYMCVATM